MVQQLRSHLGALRQFIALVGITAIHRTWGHYGNSSHLGALRQFDRPI
ncbi:hypothetical protein QUB17_02460 [Microcoleus sp. B5-C4]